MSFSPYEKIAAGALMAYSKYTDNKPIKREEGEIWMFCYDLSGADYWMYMASHYAQVCDCGE